MGLDATVNIMSRGAVAQVASLAAAAERLGYTRCWLYDEGLATRDVYVTLAAVAVRTSTIRLGPGITNPYIRHPAQAAAAIATLDELSGGRAFAGIGAGGTLTLRPLALEWRKPAKAVEEMLVTMRRLFAGETVDFDGETITYTGASLGWGRPDTEVWVAGRGRRLVDVGARLADGVHLSYLHKEYLPVALARIRAAGRGELAPVRVSYSTALVTDDAAFEQARSDLSFRIVDSPPETKQRIGVTDGEITSLRAALASGGPAAAAHHVRPEWVEQFTLVGDPAAIGAELLSLAEEHGIDEFQVAVHDLETAEEQMEAAAGLLR